MPQALIRWTNFVLRFTHRPLPSPASGRAWACGSVDGGEEREDKEGAEAREDRVEEAEPKDRWGRRGTSSTDARRRNATKTNNIRNQQGDVGTWPERVSSGLSWVRSMRVSARK